MSSFIGALLNPDIVFIRYALFAGIISAVPFGITGSFVVVKRIGYVAGAISHAVLAGIGFAMYINAEYGKEVLSPMLGAFMAAITAGVIISFVSRYAKEREDTIIGTVWAFGMAIGLLFIHSTPTYIDPMSYLFGNIQLLGMFELKLIITLAVIVVFVVVLFYNQLLLVSYDPEFAALRGLNVYFYQVLLIMLVSCTVVLMASSVGIVMVIALLTIPAGIASFFTIRLWHMIILSSIICAVSVVSGLAFSYMLAMPSGAVIIVVCGIIYFTAMLLNAIFGFIQKNRAVGKRDQIKP